MADDMTVNFDSLDSVSAVTGAFGAIGGESGGGKKSTNIEFDLQKKRRFTAEKLKNMYSQLTDLKIVDLLKQHKDLFTAERTEIEIRNIVDEYLAASPSSSDSSQPVSKFKSTSGVDYDFKSLENENDLKTQNSKLIDEYVKNLYQSEWDNFSDEEKAQKREQAVNDLLSDNNVDIAALKTNMNDVKNKKKLSDEQKTVISGNIKLFMSDIQTANANNITLKEFYALDKADRNSKKFDLLETLHNNNPEQYQALSLNDRIFYEVEVLAVEAARKETGNETMSTLEVSKWIDENNADKSKKQISRASLVYDYLKNKKEPLTETEQKILKQYSELREYLPSNDLSKVPDFDASNEALSKMLKSEVYRNALEKYKDKPNAQDLAMEEYVKDFLSSSPDGHELSKEELKARIDELFGCNPLFQGRMHKIFKKLFGDDVKMRKAGVHSAQYMASGGFKEAKASDFEGTTADYRRIWANTSANYRVSIGDNEEVIQYNRNYAEMDIAGQRQFAYEHLDEEGRANYVQSVVMDAARNQDAYTKEAFENVVSTGGSGLDGLMNENEISTYASDLGKAVQTRGDEDISIAYASSVSTYKGDAKIAASTQAKEVMRNSNRDYAKEFVDSIVKDFEREYSFDMPNAQKEKLKAQIEIFVSGDDVTRNSIIFALDSAIKKLAYKYLASYRSDLLSEEMLRDIISNDVNMGKKILDIPTVPRRLKNKLIALMLTSGDRDNKRIAATYVLKHEEGFMEDKIIKANELYASYNINDIEADKKLRKEYRV